MGLPYQIIFFLSQGGVLVRVTASTIKVKERHRSSFPGWIQNVIQAFLINQF